jgi:hypothetical protein
VGGSVPRAEAAAQGAGGLVDPKHRRLAQVGLRAAQKYGFALAGGYAVQEHGLIERPSEDVDLFTEPRDFLDVDAAITSGRYTRQQLCELAEQAHAGFDRQVLAEVFAVLERYPDRRLAAYGPAAEEIQALRARFAAWRAELLEA